MHKDLFESTRKLIGIPLSITDSIRSVTGNFKASELAKPMESSANLGSKANYQLKLLTERKLSNSIDVPPRTSLDKKTTQSISGIFDRENFSAPFHSKNMEFLTNTIKSGTIADYESHYKDLLQVKPNKRHTGLFTGSLRANLPEESLVAAVNNAFKPVELPVMKSVLPDFMVRTNLKLNSPYLDKYARKTLELSASLAQYQFSLFGSQLTNLFKDFDTANDCNDREESPTANFYDVQQEELLDTAQKIEQRGSTWNQDLTDRSIFYL